jgi:nitrite reductase (NADH) small subunit
VTVGEQSIGLFQVDDAVYALRNRCPHQGGPLCAGVVDHPIAAQVRADGAVAEYVDETRLVAACPWHGTEIDLQSGRSLANPRWRVRVYKAMIRGDDVYVEV